MPAYAGIYIYMPAYAGICKYVPAYAASCGDKPYNCVKQFFVKLKHKKWYIYYIYDFRRAIYNDIAASTSVLYRPRQKKTLGQGRALGFFLLRTKKNLAVGAISLYIALRK